MSNGTKISKNAKKILYMKLSKTGHARNKGGATGGA